MKERPILFSGPMVRAILSGRKTQTRRVVKGCLGAAHPYWPAWVRRGDFVKPEHCPYGQPGDQLWVRETFWVAHDSEFDEAAGRVLDCGVSLKEDTWAAVQYPATPENPACPGSPGTWWEAPPDDWDGEGDYHGKGAMTWLSWGCGAGPAFFSKRPGIHMPRWASRLTLEVTGVRVERLQSISEEDARAEGAEVSNGHPVLGALIGAGPSHREGFAQLWRDINGPGAWEANPWVWAVSFVVVRHG